MPWSWFRSGTFFSKKPSQLSLEGHNQSGHQKPIAVRNWAQPTVHGSNEDIQRLEMRKCKKKPGPLSSDILIKNQAQRMESFDDVVLGAAENDSETHRRDRNKKQIGCYKTKTVPNQTGKQDAEFNGRGKTFTPSCKSQTQRQDTEYYRGDDTFTSNSKNETPRQDPEYDRRGGTFTSSSKSQTPRRDAEYDRREGTFTPSSKSQTQRQDTEYYRRDDTFTSNNKNETPRQDAEYDRRGDTFTSSGKNQTPRQDAGYDRREGTFTPGSRSQTQKQDTEYDRKKNVFTSRSHKQKPKYVPAKSRGLFISSMEPADSLDDYTQYHKTLKRSTGLFRSGLELTIEIESNDDKNVENPVRSSKSSENETVVSGRDKIPEGTDPKINCIGRTENRASKPPRLLPGHTYDGNFYQKSTHAHRKASTTAHRQQSKALSKRINLETLYRTNDYRQLMQDFDSSTANVCNDSTLSSARSVANKTPLQRRGSLILSKPEEMPNLSVTQRYRSCENLKDVNLVKMASSLKKGIESERMPTLITAPRYRSYENVTKIASASSKALEGERSVSRPSSVHDLRASTIRQNCDCTSESAANKYKGCPPQLTIVISSSSNDRKIQYGETKSNTIAHLWGQNSVPCDKQHCSNDKREKRRTRANKDLRNSHLHTAIQKTLDLGAELVEDDTKLMATMNEATRERQEANDSQEIEKARQEKSNFSDITRGKSAEVERLNILDKLRIKKKQMLRNRVQARRNGRNRTPLYITAKGKQAKKVRKKLGCRKMKGDKPIKMRGNIIISSRSSSSCHRQDESLFWYLKRFSVHTQLFH